MYWLGIYLGVGILTSLRMPPNRNLHGEEIAEITAGVRVFVGLSWPGYYVLKFINRRL